MAKSGQSVAKMYPSVPAIPVAGAPVSAPIGLDEFISGAESKPILDKTPQIQTSGEPEGLEDFIGSDLKESKYGTIGQQLKAGAEGLAQGLVGPLAPMAEEALGVKAEDIRARAEENPITHYGSEIAGLVGPSLLTGGATGAARFTQAGLLEAIGSKILPGQTLASKIGASAAKGIIDNALIAGSDEASKLILKDPNTSAESAIAHIGLASILGGGIGAAAPLYSATIGRKAEAFIGDFKNRLQQHLYPEELPFEIVKPTTGTKLADAFINKALTEEGAKHIGGIAGAGIGELIGGHGGAGVGYFVGKSALGPFFNSVLPGIAKVLVENPASADGFRAATEYGLAVAKTESMLNKASANLFKAGSAILPESVYPSDKDVKKLEKLVDSIQEDPEQLVHREDHVNHYLPEHGTMLDASSGNAVSYLATLKPNITPAGPLDSKPVPSAVETSRYRSALQLAQSPMIVFDKIKNGTLTQNDIKDIGTMYPSLYNRIQSKLFESMVTQTDKDKLIPYHTRIAMSMFMTHPLDSTMQPASIQATQIGQSSQGQPQQQQQAPSKGSKSSPALQKMSGLYKTPGQNRLENKQIKD